MRWFSQSAGAFLAAGILLAAHNAEATTVLQMNLNQLSTGAGQIFRGEVINISETTVSAGGGQLPALQYLVKVTEDFKGDFKVIKGVKFAEFKVLGTLKTVETGKSFLEGFPVLRRNTEYLLMIAPAGRSGLTSVMGLGQGCFHVDGKVGFETAVNEANNVGLFSGMFTKAALPSSGPIPYGQLAAMIREAVGGRR